MRGSTRYQLQHENGVHCKFITRSEFATMLEKKLAVRVYSKSANFVRLRLLPPVKPSDSKPSPASITTEEMLAFVGIGDPAAISAARIKIRQFHPSRHGIATAKSGSKPPRRVKA